MIHIVGDCTDIRQVVFQLRPQRIEVLLAAAEGFRRLDPGHYGAVALEAGQRDPAFEIIAEKVLVALRCSNLFGVVREPVELTVIAGPHSFWKEGSARSAQ